MQIPINPENHDQNEDRINVRAELYQLENMLEEVKLKFEQYFSSIIQLPPDSIHNDAKRLIRRLRKAPFKSSAMNYKLKTLEGRYHTYNTYWQRVLREREDGVYVKDVFKANIREKNALEEARALTSIGLAEKGIKSLFETYKGALEQRAGKVATLNFDSFQDSLIKKAKAFKEKNGAEKLVFKVVVKDGKVLVKATAKKE